MHICFSWCERFSKCLVCSYVCLLASGKSTLHARLTGSDQECAGELFTTLSTTFRKLKPSTSGYEPTYTTVTVCDTVGEGFFLSVDCLSN